VNAVFINVSKPLKNPGQPYPLDQAVEIAPEVILDDPVSYESVRLTGEICGAGDAVRVTGTISCMIHSRCARCLRPAMTALETAVDEVFARDADPEYPDRYLLNGYQLDPGPMVHEALLLAMPLRFLCREDCPGFCPVCGIDLNQALCTCPKGGTRNPFAALSDLRNMDEEV